MSAERSGSSPRPSGKRRLVNSPERWGQWTGTGRYLDPRQHVLVVVHDAGYEGALKRPKDRKANTLRRFQCEAMEMHKLSGEAGILPVLDIDRSDPPRWFVMPEAIPLDKALGARPNLRDVVAAIEPLAATLGRLAERGLAHRDLKPANLFCLNGEPVIGDFGLATWPERGTLTRSGEKVGAAYFLAPEMRRHDHDVNPRQADVWSLAKTLFVLAHPERGPYPPDGTHYAGAPEFSLRAAGGRGAEEIAYLLEAATNYQPVRRPEMGQFHAELADWLALYPPGSVVRPPRPAFRRLGDPDVQVELERVERRKRSLRRHLRTAIASVTAADGSTGPKLGWEDDDGGLLLGAHGLVEPEDCDALVAVTTGLTRGRERLVLAGLLFGGEVSYLAEWQHVEDSRAPVVLREWRRDAFVELPSGAARLAELAQDLTAWVAEHQ